MSNNSSVYRITAVTLALLMFTTSVGLAVDMHYCGGQLKKISLFGKARTCHQAEDTKAAAGAACPLHLQSKTKEQGSLPDQTDCCQDRSLHIQLDQDQRLQLEGSTISKSLQQFVAGFVWAFCKLGIEPVQQAIPFGQYRPPFLSRDIPVLLQSFLL